MEVDKGDKGDKKEAGKAGDKKKDAGFEVNADGQFKPHVAKVVVSQRVGTRSATFEINKEGHTLGNTLRNQLMKDPEVDLCGYTVPHPMEEAIKVRVQTVEGSAGASEAVRKGLREIMAGSKLLLEKFDAALESHSG